MPWQTKSEKNSEKSGDFTAFLIKTALFYESRYGADGEFFELAAILNGLSENKRNERYAKKAFKNARIALQKSRTARKMKETKYREIAAAGIEGVTERAEMKAALEMLSEYERAIVELRYFYGYSAKEIAATFGISRQAATRRIKRTLDKLKAFL